MLDEVPVSSRDDRVANGKLRVRAAFPGRNITCELVESKGRATWFVAVEIRTHQWESSNGEDLDAVIERMRAQTERMRA